MIMAVVKITKNTNMEYILYTKVQILNAGYIIELLLQNNHNTE